jgi:hypothetical protein
VGEVYKRPYRVRRAAVRGKEVTIPSDVSKLQPGDTVIAFYDGFVLYVPKGTQVDEALLRRAITEATEAGRNDEPVRKPSPHTPEADNA